MAQIISTLDVPTPKAIAIDEVDGNTTYIALAKVGAVTSDPVWQIRKVYKVASVTKFLYADGNALFDNVWDNRASLTYS